MQWRTPRHWARRGTVAILLYPLSLVLRSVVAIRRWCFRCGWLASWKSPVAVVVVGNITAGGAGKTPLVIALVALLRQMNLRAGIVVRGYGGATATPQTITKCSDSAVSGDEALMLARRTESPVVAGSDRPAAVRLLLETQAVDIIICDDGLQHYALQRDIEIAVIDSDIGLGNGFFMPAGPLREAASRLAEVDMLVYSGEARKSAGYELSIDSIVNVRDPGKIRSFSQLQQTPVHAVAAIAYPQKFFRSLRDAGLDVIEHEFIDHHRFTKDDLVFADDYPVVMTEKDMVKCDSWAGNNAWYVKVTATLDIDIVDQFNRLLQQAGVKSAP